MTQHLLITHTLERLARLGVREVCVAAGARNAPLVAALADLGLDLMVAAGLFLVLALGALIAAMALARRSSPLRTGDAS